MTSFDAPTANRGSIASLSTDAGVTSPPTHAGQAVHRGRRTCGVVRQGAATPPSGRRGQGTVNSRLGRDARLVR